MRYMGIDQSLSKTAVVVIEDDKVIHHQVLLTFKGQADCPYEDILERCTNIADSIHSLMEMLDVSPHNVQLEGLSFGSSSNNARYLAMLFAVICTTCGITNPHTIAPASLKKWATGSGKATKDDMLHAVRSSDIDLHYVFLTTPISKGRFDLADAFFLAKNLQEKLHEQ